MTGAGRGLRGLVGPGRGRRRHQGGQDQDGRGGATAVLDVVAHDEAAALASAAGLDEAGDAEDAEPLAHGDQRDAEPPRELGFAGEPLARVEDPEDDAVGEALGDLLGSAGVGELGEHGFARTGTHPRLHASTLVERIPVERHRAQKRSAIG